MSEPQPTVAVTRPLPEPLLRGLPPGTRTRVWREPEPPTAHELRELCRGADAVIAFSGDELGRDVVAAGGEHLRVVAFVTAGVDGADLAALADAGVRVTNARGVADEPTADLTLALLLAVQRRVVEADRWVRAGGWTGDVPRELFGRDLQGATLGLLGFGAIARAVARRATAFGLRVQHHDRSRSSAPSSTWVPFDELLATSDVLSLHVPLTAETTGLIGREALARVRPGTVLLNTSRGAVVDTDALVEALRDGRLAGAGLDVTDPEPLPADHPLLAIDTCTVVPHVGTATAGTRRAMVEQAVANVAAVLAGDDPLTPVDAG